MSKRLDYDRVAQILVESAFFGVGKTAEKYGITERTIQRYYKRMNDDTRLSLIVRKKKELFTSENWADKAKESIFKAIQFLERAAEQADPSKPEAIHAVAGALKIQAELILTKEILDARFGSSGQSGQVGSQNHTLDSGESTSA